MKVTLKTIIDSRITLILTLFILVFSLSTPSRANAINQYSFHPESVKYFFASGKYEGRQYSVCDINGNVALNGNFSKKEYWKYSGTWTAIADLTEIKEEGEWIILSGNDTIGSFNITRDAYFQVGRAMMKAFYFARASSPIDEDFGGIYKRPAGHPDNKVYIHRSAASPSRPEGSIISCPGGWYDAGDYNKYIVNSGITVFTMLDLFESFPGQFDNIDLNIPESFNGGPDILDETLYNLKWMLSMQDPSDGGVYHKLTNKSFGEMVMPHKHVSDRYVVMKSTAASLDFAAVMAKGYRVFRNYEDRYPGLANQMLEAAIAAFKWAKDNPDVIYVQPDDIKTGAYSDDKLEDEWFWASMEMYLTTGEVEYVDGVKLHRQKYLFPQWKRVNLLPLWSVGNIDCNSIDADEIEKVSKLSGKYLIRSADRLLEIHNKSAFRVPIDTFAWGSNGDLANNGLVLVHAYLLTGNKEYLKAADAAVSYLLGANPLGYSFITGYGTRYPKNLHDRRMVSDGIDEPVPGLLAGGPTNNVQSDCGREAYNTDYPAMSYLDRVCSYSTNEVAINWNSPAASLFLSLHAIYNTMHLHE